MCEEAIPYPFAFALLPQAAVAIFKPAEYGAGSESSPQHNSMIAP
jgi:hypothetical protein